MGFLIATARHLPPREVSNAELVQFPERFRHLIEEKAGVKARRYVDHESTSDIAAAAVTKLLNKTGVSRESIEALICATSSPDRIQPATATRVQELCGLTGAFAFDVNSVCTGALYALRVANALVNDGLKNVVVVAAEVYSKILNHNDIGTAPYFGDGAAAALVSADAATNSFELRDLILYSDGSGAGLIQVAAGGTMAPVTADTPARDRFFSMVGSKVFDFATRVGPEVIHALSTRNDVTPDRVITHQANINIMRAIAERSGVPFEKFFVNVDRYANTAGASVLIALDESLEIHSSDRAIFLVAFGGGLSWGGAYLERQIV